MKDAGALLRRDAWYWSPYNKTTAGAWIGAEPIVKLPRDAPAAVLGTTVIELLAASTGPVPHPTDWKKLLEPLLAAAGVKSWRTLAAGAKSVSVESDDAFYTVCPNARDRRNNFLPLPERNIRLPISATAEELGRAIQEGASLCEEPSES